MSMAAIAMSTPSRRSTRRVLPGFHLTMGYTVLYLSLIFLIPLSALLIKTLSLSWDQFWSAVTGPRVLASYRLTFGAAFLAALDRKSTRLNSSHIPLSRMPSSA